MDNLMNPARSHPKQARSRARRQAILDAAAALIAEQGSDTVRMADIAERAVVPIGSVYQYFPDKADIISTLVVAQMSVISETLRASFSDTDSFEAAIANFALQLEAYYQLFLQQPAFRNIWASAQNDKQLQMLDLQDSRDNGANLSRALGRFVAPEVRAHLESTCFLLMHLTGASVRLAISLSPEEGRHMMDAHKALVTSALRQISLLAPEGY
jgi:AcrR family transcriptional regulator